MSFVRALVTRDSLASNKCNGESKSDSTSSRLGWGNSVPQPKHPPGIDRITDSKTCPSRQAAAARHRNPALAISSMQLP